VPVIGSCVARSESAQRLAARRGADGHQVHVRSRAPAGRSLIPVATLRRVRALIPAGLIAVLAVIGVAVARNLSPAVSLSNYQLEAGPSAEVSLSTSFSRSIEGELHSLELELARGFAFDPRAAATCSLRRARTDSCSTASRVGTGSGRILVQGPFLPRTSYGVKIAVYLTAAVHHSDLAGMLLDIDEPQSQLSVVLLGDVTRVKGGPYGLRIHFSAVGRAHPDGYELTLSQLQLDLDAHRRGARGHNYNLLTDPQPCSRAGWPLLVAISSATRTQRIRVASPCHGHH
jgi:hypothetical protein